MTDASDRRQRLEVLRDRANALLRDDGGAPALAMDVKQLVHELRVLNTDCHSPCEPVSMSQSMDCVT
jgi:hypothetical protein